MSEVFQLYSQYTGTGVIMVLFFTALVYMCLKEKDKSIRTIIIYSSIVIVGLILFPPVYYLYERYVDKSTYWRMWWMIPTGIGMAYVAAMLIEQHKATGLVLVLSILLLGGEFVYAGGVSNVRPAENAYQIPQEVIEITDYLEEYEENPTIYAAFTPELLIYVRQYDIHYQMPYGREMLDPNWGGSSSFYEAMASPVLDFEILMDRCHRENTRFIIVNNKKELANRPEDHLMELREVFGDYAIYEYVGVDWEAYFERINSMCW